MLITNIRIIILNCSREYFDTAWNETQFATESRLKMNLKVLKKFILLQERLSSWKEKLPIRFKYHIKVVVYLFGSLAFS
jgi:hypothetical protein